MVAASSTTALGHRQNNFDALRFWAALAVVWSHSFSVSGDGVRREFLYVLSNGQTTLGTFAVGVFFIVSGYLIAQSFDRSSSVWRFVKARVLRIVPALLVVLLLTVFALGPLVTSVPLAAYFGSDDTWKYLGNITFLGFKDRLPGVFETLHEPHVNGPLWTLRYEVQAYGMILLLGIAGLLNRSVAALLFVGGLIYLGLRDENEMTDWAAQNHQVKLLTLFLGGTCMYLWRIKLDDRVAALCAGLLLATLAYGGFWLAIKTAGAYLTIYAALGMPRLHDPARYGDMSYGIYIYAWPVQQLVVMALPDANWLTVFVVAAPAAMLLALLSWHLVEKRALAFKDRTFAFERPLMRRIDRFRRQPAARLARAAHER